MLIKLDNVTKTYHLGTHDYHALKGVNFEIDSGDVVAVIGPSGSGKTTTMNIIGLLDHPSSGHYYFNDELVAHLSSNELARLRNKTIGFVFQSFHLLQRLTALQNVALPLYYSDNDIKHVNDKAMTMLEKMQIADLAEHRPSELSGGQQQRVAIARALINEPAIILADEPTGALDSQTSKQIMEVLLAHQGKTTVIIITHDEDIAAQCPRRIKIRDGVNEV